MRIFSRIKPEEKIGFVRNLSLMLKAGMSLKEVLELSAKQTDSRDFALILRQIKKEIEKGVSFAQALDKRKDIFDNVFIGLVRAGETSGTLENNISFAAKWLERNHDLKSQIKSATLYPKFIISVALIVGTGLTLYVLPKLVPVFLDLEIELPWPTKILLAISIFIQSFWPWLVIAVFLLIILWNLLSRIKAIRHFFDCFCLKIPILGQALIDYQLALISQVLATLLKSGLPLAKSLEITSQAVTNICYQKSIKKIQAIVDQGKGLSEALQSFPKLYLNTLTNLVATGEKSGSLDESFVYVSNYYTAEIRNKIKRLPAIIEPVLIVIIALFVAFLALAVIMPIYQLTSRIS